MFPFTFLDHECYTCACHIPSSHNTRCTVLGFFQLSFVCSWNAIFCPLHNSIIPASEIKRHLYKSHTEWTSPKKKEESRKMAEHIMASCGLDTNQEAGNIVSQLPDELEEPLVFKGVHRCYRCPYCRTWHAENPGVGTREHYLNYHIKTEHNGNKMDVDVGEPRWTYRVTIYPGRSTHVFMLPEEWTPDAMEDGEQSDSDFSLPPLPSSSRHHLQSSITITASQDWPVRLRWESYAAEIEAGAHVKQLKKLAAPHKLNNVHQLNFLEKSISYVRCFTVKYMKEAGLIVEGNILVLGRVLVSE
jgi:hypothetical protein